MNISKKYPLRLLACLCCYFLMNRLRLFALLENIAFNGSDFQLKVATFLIFSHKCPVLRILFT